MLSCYFVVVVLVEVIFCRRHRRCLHSVVTADSLATVWTAVDDVFTSVNTEGDETAPQPTPYDEDHKTRDPG